LEIFDFGDLEFPSARKSEQPHPNNLAELLQKMASCLRWPTFSKNAPRGLRSASCHSFERSRGTQQPTESHGNLGDLVRVFLPTIVHEADESEHWLSMLKNAGLAAGSELDWLLQESGELRAIFGKSLQTARANRD
jgi:hypothetical protein